MKIKIKIKTVAQYRCPWVAIMLVGRDKVTTSEWQRSQYKFIMVCIDPHAQLNASNRRRKFIARKMRSDDNQVNTCQTLKWLSDQFALTNRIRLCFSWFCSSLNTLESFTQQIQEACMLGVYSCWSILFYGAGGHNGYQWDVIYLLIAKTHLTPSISANIHSAQEHSLLTIQTGGI